MDKSLIITKLIKNGDLKATSYFTSLPLFYFESDTNEIDNGGISLTTELTPTALKNVLEDAKKSNNQFSCILEAYGFKYLATCEISEAQQQASAEELTENDESNESNDEPIIVTYLTITTIGDEWFQISAQYIFEDAEEVEFTDISVNSVTSSALFSQNTINFILFKNTTPKQLGLYSAIEDFIFKVNTNDGTMDAFIIIPTGGDNDEANTQLASLSCNSQDHTFRLYTIGMPTIYITGTWEYEIDESEGPDGEGVYEYISNVTFTIDQYQELPISGGDTPIDNTWLSDLSAIAGTDISTVGNIFTTIDGMPEEVIDPAVFNIYYLDTENYVNFTVPTLGNDPTVYAVPVDIAEIDISDPNNIPAEYKLVTYTATYLEDSDEYAIHMRLLSADEMPVGVSYPGPRAVNIWVATILEG